VTAGGFPRPRIVPVLIVAGLCLFALKLLGLATRGGYLIAPTIPSLVQSLPRPSAPLPAGPGGPALDDITGSVPPKADKGAEKGTDKSADKAGVKAGAQPPATKDKPASEPAAQPVPPPTAAEIEVLEKLAQRRRQLEDRAKELELREAMLKTAEKTLEAKASGLRPTAAAETEGKQAAAAAAQPLKSLVIMYEAMKPRDAARVFEKMDARLMITLARAINPRKLAEIVAQMTPETAEKLTAGLMKGSEAEPVSDKGTAAPIATTPAPAASVPELPRLKQAAKPKS